MHPRWNGPEGTGPRSGREERQARAHGVRGRRGAGAALSSALVVLSAVGGVAAGGSTTAFAAGPGAVADPGTPGVAQEPKELFVENFENGMGNRVVMLPAYTGAMGTKYTADPAWLTNCNGAIVSSSMPVSEAGAAGCRNSFPSTRVLANVLGQVAGNDPNTNHAVTAFTEGDPGANKVQFETTAPVPLNVSNRFVTFSVDGAATACTVRGPRFQFSLLDGATARPVGGTLNPCTDSRARDYSGVRAGRFPATSSMLFSGTSAGIRMINAEGSGAGNDAAFDNIRLIDVTPQLDKSFSPRSVPAGQNSTVTFTITNTNELGAKNGWSFTDRLPTGVTLASAPTTNCPSASVTGAVGGSSIALTGGNLNANQVSCTVTAQVTSRTAGDYVNTPDDVTTVGLNAPADAPVTFTESADLVSEKDSLGTGPLRPGQTFDYRVTARNRGPS
ncbi:DUF11 domain-containing protein, partial [Streptomyces sp. NPDC001941]